MTDTPSTLNETPSPFSHDPLLDELFRRRDRIVRSFRVGDADEARRALETLDWFAKEFPDENAKCNAKCDALLKRIGRDGTKWGVDDYNDIVTLLDGPLGVMRGQVLAGL